MSLYEPAENKYTNAFISWWHGLFKKNVETLSTFALNDTKKNMYFVDQVQSHMFFSILFFEFDHSDLKHASQSTNAHYASMAIVHCWQLKWDSGF